MFYVNEMSRILNYVMKIWAKKKWKKPKILIVFSLLGMAGVIFFINFLNYKIAKTSKETGINCILEK